MSNDFNVPAWYLPFLPPSSTCSAQLDLPLCLLEVNGMISLVFVISIIKFFLWLKPVNVIIAQLEYID